MKGKNMLERSGRIGVDILRETTKPTMRLCPMREPKEDMKATSNVLESDVDWQ